MRPWIRQLGLFAVWMLAVVGCRDRADPDSRVKEQASAVEASAVSMKSGEALYTEHCAVCHMPDGGGVPNFQPGLVGSPIVAGDPVRLEIVVRAGSAALRDRPNEFGTEMPPFGYLSDAEVKSIVAFVRSNFAAPSEP